MAARSILRIAAESAYSGKRAKFLEGAPWLVLPPAATNSVWPSALSCMPLTEWFSSERGSPRTRSVLTHWEPFQLRREMIPELVSRLRSVPEPPAPMRGSLDPTYITGAACVPATSMPVTCRPVTDEFKEPSSLRLDIELMRLMVSVFVTEYALAPVRWIVEAL